MSATAHPSPAAGPATRRSFWRSPSLLVALALTLVGVALWLRVPAATPPPPAPPPAGSLASGFAATRSAAAPTPPPSDRPFIGKESPLLFRFGAGYLGGFLVGWVWRKSVKAALSLGATALALIAAAKQFGIGGADLQALQSEVAQGVGWLQHQAGALKDWLSGYVPSGVAGVVGLWRGARWK
jgi:uncharacterized membrane protein (Fun14 family)